MFNKENDERETRVKNYKTKPPPQIKPLEIKPEKIEIYKKADPSTYNNKEFKNWYTWWQTNLSSEDYFKYLSTQVFLEILF